MVQLQSAIERGVGGAVSQDGYAALYKQMFTAHSAVMLLLDPESGAIVAANPAAARFYGYPLETLQQMTITQINLLPPTVVGVALHQALTGERDHFFFQHRLASGEVREVETYSVPIQMGERTFLYSIIHDITERKQAEEALQVALTKYQTLFENFPLGITVSDLTGQIVETNPVAERLLGIPQTEQLRRTIDDSEWRIVRPNGTLMPPEEYASVRAFKEQRRVDNVEMGIVKAPDAITWINVTAAPLPVAGYGVVVTYGDITDRKLMEAALRKNLARYRKAQRLGQVGNWEYYPQTAEFWGSEEAKRIYGFDPDTERFTTEEVEKCIPERVRVHQALVDLLERDQEYNLEFDIFTHDTHERRTIISLAELERDAAGQPFRVTGVIQDITERRQAEADLRIKEWALQSSINAIALADLAGKLTYINPAFLRMWGYQDSQEVLGRPAFEFWQAQESAVEVITALQTQGHWIGEMAGQRQDATLFDVEVVASMVVDDAGTPLCMYAAFVDITERKRAVFALYKYNRLFEAVIHQAPFAIHVLEGDRQHIRVVIENYESVRIMGERLLGRADIDAETPETLHCRFFSVDGRREIPLAEMPSPRAFNGEVVQNEEFLFRHPDSTEILVEASAAPVYDALGDLLAVVVSFHDITERKQAETALHAALAATERQARENRWLMTAAQAVLDCHTFDEAARRIFDVAREATGAVSGYVALLSADGAENELLFLEAGGLPCAVDPELPMPVRGLRAQAYAQGGVVYENAFMQSAWVDFMPPGHVTMRNVLFAPILVGERAVGVLGLANKPADFTPEDARVTRALADMAAVALRRTQAEERLRETNAVLQTLIESAPLAIIWVDAAGRVKLWNPAAQAMFGWSAVEVLGQPNPIVPPEAEALFRDTVTHTLQGQPLQNVELRRLRRDGGWIEVSLSTALLRDTQGRSLGVIGILTDITARKQTEAQVQAQLDELRAWHTVALEREQRILALKQEVNTLLAQTAAPPRYADSDADTRVLPPAPAAAAPERQASPVTDEIVPKWQAIVNLLAELLQIPAALIMKAEPPEIAVFVASQSPGNPYRAGERAPLHTGLYCETVMSTRRKLLVPNARRDPQWDHNPDIPLGMISYLGFPISWPDGAIFGTLCVLDAKENAYSPTYERLLRQFRDIIEADLRYQQRFEQHTQVSAHARRALLSMLEDAHQSAAALRASEEQYRSLFTEMLSGFALHEIVCDPAGVPVDYRFLVVNAAFEQLTGLSAPALIGRTVREVMPAIEPYWIERYGQVALTGTPVQFEEYSGALGKYYEARAYCPEPGKFAVIFADVTARRRAEEALRESTARLERAEQIGKIGHWEYNFITQTITWSEETYRLYARDPQLGPPTVTEEAVYYTPEDNARLKALAAQVLATQTPVEGIEFQVQLPDGRSAVYCSAIYLMLDENAAPRTLFGTVQDITERKRAEAALRQSAERLQIQHEIDAAILAAQSPEAIGIATLTHLRALIPFQLASVSEIDLPQQRGRDFVVFAPERGVIPAGEWRPLEDNADLMADFAQGAPYLVGDIAAQAAPSRLERWLLAQDLRAYVSMPLRVQGVLVGSLNLAAVAPDFFRPTHLEVLCEVADSLAIALQQARLLEQTQADAETKALLLREVNHRVLNNLTMMQALLDLERRTTIADAADFRAILADLHHRIEGLILVHRLLSSTQWAPLPLSDLISQIIHAALHSSPIRNALNIAINAPVMALCVSPQQAVAVALIFNELATNSVKYAFAGRHRGEIRVDITVVEGQPTAAARPHVRLVYQDDGSGWPEAVLQSGERNTGLWIIETNVRHALGGVLAFYNDHGAVTDITFQL